MPILEFECKRCEAQFERLVLRSSGEPTCPVCESSELERIISISAVSSDQTRARALRGAKKRVGKIRREREIEEHKIRHEHMHDDH